MKPSEMGEETIGGGLTRIKVHGGWMLSKWYETSFYGCDGDLQSIFLKSSCFINDPTHQWLIQDCEHNWKNLEYRSGEKCEFCDEERAQSERKT